MGSRFCNVYYSEVRTLDAGYITLNTTLKIKGKNEANTNQQKKRN